MLNAKIIVSLLVVGGLSGVSLANTPSKLINACKKDLKKFGCVGETDAEAHACLEKHEKKGAKHEGFSAGCYWAHEAYEKNTGTEKKEK